MEDFTPEEIQEIKDRFLEKIHTHLDLNEIVKEGMKNAHVKLTHIQQADCRRLLSDIFRGFAGQTHCLGSFTSAVMRNDLHGTILHGTDSSVELLPVFVWAIHMNVPYALVDEAHKPKQK